jgi:hypothetical protein
LGKTLTIRRGGKEGPTIAVAECCEDKQGSSKIQLEESSTTVDLEHVPRRALVFPPKTTLTIDEREYYWKGYTDLFDKKSDKLVAQYHSFEAGDKVGEILIAEGKKDEPRSKNFQDVVIISAFIMQHRSSARARAVCSPIGII